MNDQEKFFSGMEFEPFPPFLEAEIDDEIEARKLKALKAMDTDKLLRMSKNIEREQSKNSQLLKLECNIKEEIRDSKWFIRDRIRSLEEELQNKTEELSEKSFLEKMMPIMALITAIISVILLVINIASH